MPAEAAEHLKLNRSPVSGERYRSQGSACPPQGAAEHRPALLLQARAARAGGLLLLLLLLMLPEQRGIARGSHLGCSQVQQRRENIRTWGGRGKAAGVGIRDGEGCFKCPFFVLPVCCSCGLLLNACNLRSGRRTARAISLLSFSSLSIKQSSLPPPQQRPKLSG